MTRARAARGRAAPSGKPSRNIASVFDRLKPEEAATVLQRLLAAHPDLRAEAGKMASDLLGEVSFENVACEIEEAARALDLDDLNSRAGSYRWGYKEPTDAAWELLEEVVEPFLEDMKRQAELQSPANALEICKGVVLGLYRVRHEPDGCTVLGWAPDFAPETAMWAVETWSTGGGGTWKVRSARRSPRRSSRRTSPSGVYSSPRHFHGHEIPVHEAKPVGS
jgi:hypothetical protein